MADTLHSIVKQSNPMAAAADAVVANEVHELPDCIIASSNRFDDLRPFCDRCYVADPRKWGAVLPWEFPQNASREVEESFLREWFDALEIHMQGGAYGDGAGFRFLKQAWYSIALYNWEHRVPAIANMWTTENKDLVEDPSMFDYLCSLEVQVDTFFKPHDIETYGEKLLGFAVRKIQEAIRLTREPTVIQQINSNNSAAVITSSDSAIPTVQGEMKSEPSMSMKPQADQVSTLNRSKTMEPASPPAMQTTPKEQTVPFPPYNESARGLRGSSRDFTPSYDGRQHSQVYARKRGMSNGKRYGSGSASYHQGRQQYNHHEYGRMSHPGVQEHRISGDFSFPMSPAHQPHQGPASHQPSRNMNPSAGQFVPPGFQGSDAYPNVPYVGFSQDSMRGGYRGDSGPWSARNFSNGARNFSNEFVSIDFEDLTNRRGGFRRDSQGSRGAASFRGNARGGRGRGGRDNGSFSDHHGSFNDRQMRNEFGNKSGKRHTSNAQENIWHRQGERPQSENQFPERFSGRDMSATGGYGTIPRIPMSSDLKLMSIHINNASVNPPSSTGSRTYSERRQPSNQQRAKDDLVDRDYVGADATDIRSLILFNIPSQVSEMEIASTITHVFGVPVARLQKCSQQINNAGYCLNVNVVVEFDSHHQVRQVLSLKGAELFGKPTRVEVMAQWWDTTHRRYEECHAADGTRIPQYDMNRYPRFADGQAWQNYGQDNLPHRKLFDPKAPPSNPVLRNAAAGVSHAMPSALAYSLKVPPGKKHDTTLSTVPSAESTPTGTSEPTPKKIKKKPKKDKANLDGAVPHRTPHSAAPRRGPAAGPDEKSTSNVDPTTSFRTKEIPATGKAVARTAQEAKLTVPDGEAHKDASGFDSKRPSEAQPGHKAATPLENSNTKITVKSSADQTSKQYHAKSESEAVDDSFHTAKGSPSDASQLDDNVGGMHVEAEALTRATTPAPSEQVESVSPRTTGNTVAASADNIDPTKEEAETSVQEPVVPEQTEKKKLAAAKKSNGSKRKAKSSNGQPSGPTTNAESHVSASSTRSQSTATSAKESAAPFLTAPRVVSDGSASRSSAFQTAPSTPALPQQLDDVKAADTTRASSEIDTAKTASSGTAEPGDPSREAQDAKTPADGSDKAGTVMVTETPDSGKHPEGQKVQEKGKSKAVEEVRTPSEDTAEAIQAPEMAKQSHPREDGQSKVSSQAKAPEKKKGPEQTESFSMFGKKQNKKTKKSKGGTVRGKPGSLNGDGSRVASGASTPSVQAEDQRFNINASANGKGKAAKVDRSASALKENSAPSLDTTMAADKAVPRSSVSSSPNKGYFNNFLGLIMGTSKPASVASSPDLMSNKSNTENELTESKKEAVSSDTFAAHAQTAGAVGHGLTAELVAKSQGSIVSGDTTSHVDSQDKEPTGLGISGSSESPRLCGTNTEGTPKKGNSGKGKQNQRTSSAGAEFDETPDGDALTNFIPNLALDQTESNKAGSDDRSMSSSRAIGKLSPPVSPESKLTPSKRKQFDTRSEPSHILKAPAPLNYHAKRKPSSKTPSESASQSSGEATPTSALERYRANAKNKRHNNALLNMINVNNRATLVQRNADGDEEAEEEEGGRHTLLYFTLANHTSEDVSEHSNVQLVGTNLHFLGGSDSDAENRVLELEDVDSPEAESGESGKQSPASETEPDEPTHVT